MFDVEVQHKLSLVYMKTSIFLRLKRLISFSPRERKHDFIICGGIGQFLNMSSGQMEPMIDKLLNEADMPLNLFIIIFNQFDLGQEYFYFTAFPFVQKLHITWYDSVVSVWLSSESDMQTWPQYSFQQGIPFCFPLTGVCASFPHFWSLVHRTAANLCPKGFPLKHKQRGSNGLHRWQRQTETQVEELNPYNKGNGPKHFKEDLGPQILCCTTTKTCSFYQTGNPFISVRKIN